MKEFQAIFPISPIFVISSAYAKKNHFSILAIFQNVWDLHKFGFQIWIHNVKITLWKNFGQFFQFHRFSCKKRSFLNISCNLKYMGFTKIWVTYLNSECKNYPMKEFRAIFPISSILVIRSGYAKKSNFPILAVFQNVWDLHKFGLQIWIQNAKITLWKNFGQFFQFHRFSCKKRSFLNISCNLKYMGFTKIWVTYLNSECKNYPMKEFRAIFPISSILVIRSGYAKKEHFSILAVIQNIWDLHKFGLQIWIQNAKITLWNNFGQFSWFHRFWSSGPGNK